MLVDNEGISIFKCVFGSPVEVFGDFRPFFQPLVIFDELEQLDIFIELPGSLLELGTQITGPMFAALLGVSINFALVLIQSVQFLRDLFPVLDLIIAISLSLQSFVNYVAEDVGFFLGPIMRCQCDLLQTEPLEHAGAGTNPGDHGGDHSPILVVLRKKSITISFSRSTYFRRSQYLEMTQMSILRSSSPQFLLIRLVLSILSKGSCTFRS